MRERKEANEAQLQQMQEVMTDLNLERYGAAAAPPTGPSAPPLIVLDDTQNKDLAQSLGPFQFPKKKTTPKKNPAHQPQDDATLPEMGSMHPLNAQLRAHQKAQQAQHQQRQEFDQKQKELDEQQQQLDQQKVWWARWLSQAQPPPTAQAQQHTPEEVTLRRKQIAAQTAREARPAKKFCSETPMEFRNTLSRFYLAVDNVGMNARMKLNEMGHWFGGSAAEFVECHVSNPDAEMGYAQAISQLESLFGGNCDSALPLVKQLSQGKAIGENDLDGHLQLLSKLWMAESVAQRLGQRDQLDRRESIAEIAEARVRHIAKEIWKEDARRQIASLGRGMDFDTLKAMVKMHITILQNKRTLLPINQVKVSSVEVVSQQVGQDGSGQAVGRENEGWRSYSKALKDSPEAKQSTIRCNVCNQYHATELCNVLLEMSPDERVTRLRDRKLCFHCLEKGHFKPSCKNIPTCDICGRRHNTLVHGRTPPQELNVNASSTFQQNPHHHLYQQTQFQHQSQVQGHLLMAPNPPLINPSVNMTGATKGPQGLETLAHDGNGELTLEENVE